MANTAEGISSIKQSWAEKRKSIKPKAIRATRTDLIKTSFLREGVMLPLIIEPNVEDLDLPTWISNNMNFVSENLLNYGGLLFRGFGLKDENDFHRYLDSTSIPLMYYMEGATPRTQLGGKVYTSTQYPADRHIALHNELCYVMTWPMKIWFFCVQPPAQGGETPIADVRRVYERIDPKIRKRFEEKGWMLMRNFSKGLGLPWQTSYRAEDKPSLENYLRSANIEFEWLDEDRVRTRQVRPAVARHSETGEMVWFNHIAFWHVSSLDLQTREVFLAQLGEDGLPFNTYYGDGSVIEDEVAANLRAAYDDETIAFQWQEGDALMLDNMLVAHGRKPYIGARQILTAMGEPCSDRGL